MRDPSTMRDGLAVALALLLTFLTLGSSRARPDELPDRQAAPILRPFGDYLLPGRATRWDYMSFDPSSARLYLAHLGDGNVVAVDTTTRKVTGTIAGISDVHGVLAVPELARIYATATGTNEVVAIDAATRKIVARIPAGSYPDGLAYVPGARKLYVSDEEGKTETVVDVRSNRRIATIPLGGAVGNTQYDAVSGHVFVNVQGRAELVEIDPDRDSVIRRMPLPGAEGNHGLLIEPRRRLAFIACEGNHKLLVANLRSGKVVARFDVGNRPDVLAYDAAIGLLYVAGEAGVVSVFRVGRQGVTKVGDQFVGPNAHTVAVDPASHDVYFPLNRADGRAVLRVMRPRP